MSNPLNVSLGELPASGETGGPLPLQRLQSGGETGFHQIIAQVKMNLPLWNGGGVTSSRIGQGRLPEGGDVPAEI